MINKAAEALVELINEDDLARRATFPENVDIREIACHLAARVFIQAIEENLVVRSNLFWGLITDELCTLKSRQQG